MEKKLKELKDALELQLGVTIFVTLIVLVTIIGVIPYGWVFGLGFIAGNEWFHRAVMSPVMKYKTRAGRMVFESTVEKVQAELAEESRTMIDDD